MSNPVLIPGVGDLTGEHSDPLLDEPQPNERALSVFGNDSHEQKYEKPSEEKHKVKSLRPINVQPYTIGGEIKRKISVTDSNSTTQNKENLRCHKRFFHESLEVKAKITDEKVMIHMEKRREKKAEQKDANVSDGNAGTKPETESSSNNSSESKVISPLTMVRDQSTLTELIDISEDTLCLDEEIVRHDTWQYLDTTPKEETLKTRDTGDYSYFKPESATKIGRRICFFDGKMKRVSKIDTCDETFHIVFHFYATWLMSYNEVLRMKAAVIENNGEVKDDWKPKSYPQFEICNKVDGEMKQVGKFQLKDGAKWPKKLTDQNPKEDFKRDCHPGSGFDINPKDLGFYPINAFYCRVKYECQFTCAEEMELEMFPFDCQDLSTYLRLKQKADKWDVLPLPRHGEIFNIHARFSMVSEWKIPGVLLEFEPGDPNVAKDGIGYNSVIIRVKAERKWESHITDSIVICCMFWLGLVTFGIPVEEVGERLAYCITLLLTDVATMQLLNESIPNIPYRTFFDTYTYTCFVFLVSITTWVTAAGWHGHRAALTYQKDWIAFVIFLCTALAVHIYFIYHIMSGNKLEKSKLMMDSKGLDEFFHYMSHVSSMPTAGVYWNSHTIEEPDREDKGGLWSSLSYPFEGYPQSQISYFSKPKK